MSSGVVSPPPPLMVARVAASLQGKTKRFRKFSTPSISRANSSMFGAEKDLDAVRVTIHRGLAGRERCVFGSLTIAIKSRTPSLARSASNSAPNGGAVDPGNDRSDAPRATDPGPTERFLDRHT